MIPVVSLGLGWYFAKRKVRLLESAVDKDLLTLTIASRSLAEKRRKLRLAWYAVVSSLIVLALLRPQWGFIWKESQRKGVDIVVAVDVSDSMLVQDLKPDRLTRARREIIDLLETLRGDRVSLVSFAGTAFIETPLTLDYSAFRLFLSSLKPSLIPVKGTNIESAVTEAIRAFEKGSSAGKKTSKMRSRALLLITDGEDFAGSMEELGEKAKEHGVQIYIIGVGTTQGGPIPGRNGLKKSKDGKIVISKLNEEALKDLATRTGGVYVTSITSARDTVALYDLGIRKRLESSSIEEGKAKRWNEYFQVPLLLAILCLILGPWGRLALALQLKPKAITNSDDTQNERKTGPGAHSALILLLFSSIYLGLPADAAAESAALLGKAAKRDFETGNFKAAISKFQEIEKLAGQSYKTQSGIASAYYRMEEFDKAHRLFTQAAESAKSDKNKASALYNAGNSLVQQEKYEEAIKTYQQSLQFFSGDAETKENLEFAKKKLKEKQEQQKQEEKQQEQEQEKQEEEKKKDQEEKEQKQQNKQEKDQQEQEQQNKQEEKDQEQEQQEQSGEQGEEENEDKGGTKQDEQESKEDESSANQPQDPKEDEQEPERAEESGAPGDEKDSQEPGETLEEITYDQLESQLENIKEKTGKRMKYRLREGMKQLEDQNRGKPEQDW